MGSGGSFGISRWGRRALLCLGLLAGGPAFAGEAKVVILSPHWEGIRKEYTTAFEAWHRAEYGQPATLEWLDMGGTSDDVKFIQSGFSSGKASLGVDLFWGGGIDPYVELAKGHYFQPYRLPEPLLRAIPAHLFGLPLYDPQFRWYGTALAGFGILYNKVVLQYLHLAPPETWEDLADPRLFTWVGSADPRHSGSVHMMYEIILQAYGWEKGFEIIRGMGANIRSFPKSSSQTPKDTALGEVAAGLAIDIYALTQIDEAGSDKLAYVMPEGQTVINPDGIAILRGAPHLELAQRFIRFVLSPAGQRLLMLPQGAEGGPREFSLNRMSVLPALYEELGASYTAPTNPFAWKTSLPYDSDKGGRRWGLVNDLIGVLVIDTHDQLVAAWRAFIQASQPPAARRVLYRLPLTEQEAEALAANWEDPALRGRKINEWLEFAQRQYAEVRRLCGPYGRDRLAWLKAGLRGITPALVLGLLLFFIGDLAKQGGCWMQRRFSHRDRKERP